MVKGVRINREAVKNIVRMGLKLRSYKLGKSCYLDKRMKRVRLENAQHFHQKKSFGLILFTDEKVFRIELLRNSQGIIQNFLLFQINYEFLEKSQI